MELKIRLQPKQRQFLQSVEKTHITFYGGAKGGGKSKGLQLIMLLRRLQYPGSVGVIFRRTYPELEDNHITPLFQAYPDLKEFYNESKKTITLPNKSLLRFRHCASEKDVGQYSGREFHDLGIDEAGQWTEGMFRTLLGSNRSSRPGIPSRTMLTGNPGGVGHGWLKRLFIERRFNDRERPEDHAFIQALVDDNPALMENDPNYVRTLESEPNEALRKAYRYGDWNIFAGQFFQEINRDVHFIKPFDIPRHWNRFGAYDFGYNHPGAFGWFANDTDGNTYLYREFVRAGLRVDQFSAELNKFAETKDLYPIVAGHDCWAKKSNTVNAHQGENPPTIAEEFRTQGINLKPAILDRIQGAAQLRSYLAWREKTPPKPRLFIFNTCPITFDCVSRMIHDPDRLEDVLKVDAAEGDPNTGDDAYDMLRYGMMSRPLISDVLKVQAKPGTKEHSDEMAAELFRNTQEKLQKEKNAKDGEGITWNTDADGTPDWNKW